MNGAGRRLTPLHPSISQPSVIRTSWPSEVPSHGMGKKVIPFPRKNASDSDSAKAARSSSRILLRVGRQRYAVDIACTAMPLAPQEDPTAELKRRPDVLEVETKFLRLRQPAALGDRIDGWRVCWLGGWDRGKVFFVVMVERVVHRGQSPSALD